MSLCKYIITFLLYSDGIQELIEKLIRKTLQLERLIAGGKVNLINGTIVMRKVLEKELLKAQTGETRYTCLVCGRGNLQKKARHNCNGVYQNPRKWRKRRFTSGRLNKHVVAENK